MAVNTETWRGVFDSLEDPIFLHDAHFRVVLANAAYCREAGVPAADALGRPYWEVFPRGVGPLPGCARAVTERGHACGRSEVSVGAKVLLSTASTVPADQGRLPYFLHILSDISERKQTAAQLARVSRMYRTVSRCNTVMVHAADEMELVREMCRVLVEEVGFRAAWVGYADPNGGKQIQPVAVAGAAHGEIAAMNLTWEENEAGHEPTAAAIRTGEVVVSQDILHDPRWACWRDQAIRRGYAAAATFPLTSHGRVLGALDIYSAEADAFTPEMVDLLTAQAADLAFGIDTLRARAERLCMLEKLEQSLDHAVTAIAATVEMRDPYTAGHQRRVAKLTVAIAAEMGLAEERVQGLRVASVVHDIGKIHVPAEILSSPSKLSEAEFEIIKTHSKVGWEILKGIDFPWPVAEMVYQHHEKLDGSGYPRGLKGEEILLETRILTVADVVEAMTSHRPYRPGIGILPALQEISQHRGGLYEETAVKACLQLFMEKGYEW